MKILIIKILIIAFSLPIIAFGQSLEGKIIDIETGEGLDYVTIRVIGKNIGTVSTKGGTYNIDISRTTESDTLIFSYIGYNSYLIPINNLISTKKRIIQLNPEIKELNQIVITAKKEFRLLGNHKVDRKYTGWGDFESQKGRIKGLLIEGGECPVKIKSLSFRINHNEWDSVAFRINFLKLEGNNPSESILKENIFVTTDKKRKWVKVDLDEQNIIICEKIITTLEWVDSWGMTGEYSNLLTLSLSKNTGYTLSQEPGQEIGSFTLEDNAPAIFLEVYGN